MSSLAWMASRPDDRVARIAILMLGLVNLVRGAIHVFAPHGGAESIAGFDLSQATELIVFLFAVMGLHQLSLGCVDLLAGLRFRALVVPLLWFHTLQQTASVAMLLLWKAPPGRPPGAVGAFAGVIVLWAVLAWTLRAAERRRPGSRIDQAARTHGGA